MDFKLKYFKSKLEYSKLKILECIFIETAWNN